MKTIFESLDVRKNFGQQKVLKGIDFSINQGEIIGLLGVNGAGKSTFMKLCVHLLKVDSGDLQIMGLELSKNWDNLYKEVSILLEPKFPAYLTGEEFLKQTAILKKAAMEEVNLLLYKVGLESSRDKKIKEYSFGMQQRLGLASALIGNPKILILDEPFVGLDPSGIRDIQELLIELSEEGTTILISSHQLIELKDIVDRIIFLENGMIQSEITKEDLTKTVAVQMKTSNNIKAFSYLQEVLPNEDTIKRDGDFIIISSDSHIYTLEELSLLLQREEIKIVNFDNITFDLRSLFGGDVR